MNNGYFFDDEEEGLAKETSHPNFVKGMTAEFYYDCLDDFAPFGNDDGADILYQLSDWYREKKLTRNVLKWVFERIDEAGCKYQSEGVSEVLTLETLNDIQQEDEYLIQIMDNSILAAAFGQIKITGKIDQKLLEKAKIAIKRQQLLNTNPSSDVGLEYANRLATMEKDLLNFQSI